MMREYNNEIKYKFIWLICNKKYFLEFYIKTKWRKQRDFEGKGYPFGGIDWWGKV